MTIVWACKEGYALQIAPQAAKFPISPPVHVALSRFQASGVSQPSRPRRQPPPSLRTKGKIKHLQAHTFAIQTSSVLSSVRYITKCKTKMYLSIYLCTLSLYLSIQSAPSLPPSLASSSTRSPRPKTRCSSTWIQSPQTSLLPVLFLPLLFLLPPPFLLLSLHFEPYWPTPQTGRTRAGRRAGRRSWHP